MRQRTTAALLVHRFNLRNTYVGAIGTQLGGFDPMHTQRYRFACCLYLVGRNLFAFTIGNGAESSGFPCYGGESEEESMAALAMTERLAVEEQFYIVAGGANINGFHYRASFCIAIAVVPMTDDIGFVCLQIHPSVPHHAVAIPRVFGDTHSVHIAGCAVRLLTTGVCVAIRENDLRTSGIDAFAGARTS